MGTKNSTTDSAGVTTSQTEEAASEIAESEIPPEEADDITFTQAIRIQESPDVY